MWISLIIMGTVEIFLIVFAIFFVTQVFNMLFRGFAPYISTRSIVISKIIDEIKVNDGAKIYELGCGKAGFLKAFEEKFPKAELIGVEYSFWPYFVAKIQLSLEHSRIKIMKRNMFKINLSDASLVYCYLNPKMMELLEKKFSEECKPGTQIISYTFKMPTKQPTKVVEINKNNKVYFYTV
jgi:16S rRNA A1518/A1519 N6-dimethyltransferase RsmA/KsgA/DIM1 with predicted DNA glycosylase/AP lyase activity